jgi:hypothetical protein
VTRTGRCATCSNANRRFTERLYQEARGLDLRVIAVDTPMTEAELARQVTEVFGL